MRRAENFIKYIVIIVLGLVMSATVLFLPLSAVAFAEDNAVLSELEASVIDGKSFSASSYPVDANGETEFLFLTEHDYGGDFCLYVYVYNPTQTVYSSNTTKNMVTIRIGEYNSAGDDSEYKKHILFYVADYDNLYIKYRVNVSTVEANQLEANGRVYSISEIELIKDGSSTAESFSVGRTYTYKTTTDGISGTETVEEILSFDVNQTWYRPEGTNEYGAQDTLYSVYFSIPNSVINTYGELDGVHTYWQQALTQPIFVTDNEDVYNGLYECLGVSVGDGYNSDIGYSIWTTVMSEGCWPPYYNCGSYYYNLSTSKNNIWVINTLYYAFHSSEDEDYAVSWDEFYSFMKDHYLSGTEFDDDIFYSKEDYTDKWIYSTDEYDLTSISYANWWDVFTGNTEDVPDSYSDIQAIYKVTASDMASTSSTICENLLMNEGDYDVFAAFYAAATAKNESVYLFRFDVSDYTALSVPVYKKGSVSDVAQSGTHYLATMNVYLDFDIIECRFGAKTFAVASSPIDIGSGVTKPAETVGSDFWDWLKKVLAVVFAILLVVALFPVISIVVRAVGGVVKGAVSAVSKTSKKISDNDKKIKKEKKRNDKK